MKPRPLEITGRKLRARNLLSALLALAVLLAACAPQSEPIAFPYRSTATPVPAEAPLLTAFPTRPPYEPGTLVDYVAQTGDTLPALAAHFNTSVDEILSANPIIPQDATTMPPGMPMKIPIYYQPLWGSPFQILPDALFINGPAQIGFDPVAFVKSQPGWFKNYSIFLGEKQRTGGEIVAYVAGNYSVSPRLLLAVLEYQAGALSLPEMPAGADRYTLGLNNVLYDNLAQQLIWAADTLNDGYYGWRSGSLRSFDHLDGRLERPDPWQNAASVALQAYYAQVMDGSAYALAIGSQGVRQAYTALFGDPWAEPLSHIPGSLVQPEMRLPFNPGVAWAYTGGPHSPWGSLQPWAALDFAPPTAGCAVSSEWATAVADGVIARSGGASLVLDLDGDGDERTGWIVFYLHLANASLSPVGKQVKAGDLLGQPSCEGGRATGTHVHLARKYNGEWVSAEGVLAFNLGGWIAHNGSAPYEGTLTRYGASVRASTKSDNLSIIRADAQ